MDPIKILQEARERLRNQVGGGWNEAAYNVLNAAIGHLLNLRVSSVDHAINWVGDI